jgi:hypothetical protein
MDTNQIRNRATAIMGKRIENSTSLLYSRKIAIFKMWLQTNYPIHINSDSNIMYSQIDSQIYMEFFASRTIKPPASIKSKRKNKTSKFQSYQHDVSGFKSAILSDMTDAKHKPSAEVMSDFKIFFAGYKREVASKKSEGEMSVTEGKSAFSFSSYIFLTGVSIKQSLDDLNTFAHLFLILCWNLIARCNSVARIRYNHITWKDDSLVRIENIYSYSRYIKCYNKRL